MTMDPQLKRAIADLTRVGIIPPNTTIDSIEDLVVMGATSLEGIGELRSLQTLTVRGGEGIDFTVLAGLTALHVLSIENTTLESAEGMLPPEIRTAVMRRNRLRSLTPFAELAGLQVLDVSGNPLDEDATDVGRLLRDRGVVLTIDDNEVLALNRRLADEHPDFVCFGTRGACTLTVTGLSRVSEPDRVAVVTTAAEIAARIGDGQQMTELMKSQWE